jgi:hypothetical protein
MVTDPGVVKQESYRTMERSITNIAFRDADKKQETTIAKPANLWGNH